MSDAVPADGRVALLAAAAVVLDLSGHLAAGGLAAVVVDGVPRSTALPTLLALAALALPLHGAVRAGALDALRGVLDGDAPATAARHAAASAGRRLLAWGVAAAAVLAAGGWFLTALAVASVARPRPAVVVLLGAGALAASWLVVAGPRSALRLAGARSRRVFGVVATLPGLVAGGGVLLAADAVVNRHEATVAVVAVFAGAVLARALAAGLVVGLSRSGDAETDASPLAPLSTLDRRRLALAGLVAVAALGGAGWVRVADDGVGAPDAPATVTDATPPAVAYDRALSNTRAADRRVTTVVNGSVRYRIGIDREKRRALLRANLTDDPGFDGAVYLADGTFAQNPAAGSVEGSGWMLVKGASNGWLHYAAPGYDDHAARATPAADLDTLRGREWTRVAVRDRRAVLLLTDAGVDPRTAPPTRTADLRGSRIRATVDLRGDHLLTVRYAWRYATAGGERTVTRTLRFADVGVATVRRPSALGPRRPAEWCWDAAAY